MSSDVKLALASAGSKYPCPSNRPSASGLSARTCMYSLLHPNDSVTSSAALRIALPSPWRRNVLFTATSARYASFGGVSGLSFSAPNLLAPGRLTSAMAATSPPPRSPSRKTISSRPLCALDSTPSRRPSSTRSRWSLNICLLSTPNFFLKNTAMSRSAHSSVSFSCSGVVQHGAPAFVFPTTANSPSASAFCATSAALAYVRGGSMTNLPALSCTAKNCGMFFSSAPIPGFTPIGVVGVELDNNNSSSTADSFCVSSAAATRDASSLVAA
mmetsp:Transcript_16750/g.42894  ORF Transcript_16750/g.42894 Transcript_16750/m.42894 type:complete len:271 (-) Transcript_16750:147-959(-)